MAKGVKYRKFGELIWRTRKAKGLTQQKLARKAGIGQAFLSKLENGAHAPDVRTFYGLCRALGLRAEPSARLLF